MISVVFSAQNHEDPVRAPGVRPFRRALTGFGKHGTLQEKRRRQGVADTDMQAFSPAQTQKAPDVIYDQIYQRIVSGKLKSGDRLPSERVLAEQFQRSRHIIREALRMLQQDGLITIEVGSAGGAIIQGISIDMLSAPLKKYLSSGDLDLRELTDYEFWYAQYSTRPSYRYHFQMWQYSSSGDIPGISSNVDLNISFVPYGE